MFKVKKINITCREQYNRKYAFKKEIPVDLKTYNDYYASITLEHAINTKYGKVKTDVKYDINKVISPQLYSEFVSLCERISQEIKENKKDIRRDEIE